MEKYVLLFESIFKRKLSADDAVSYLEGVTKEHPYFSVAQFYLLQLSQKGINGYQGQAKKTAVLFNNNHWLNFQLLEAGFDNKPTIATEPIVEQIPINENLAYKIYTEEKTAEPVVIAAEEKEEVPAITNTYPETIIEEQENIAVGEQEEQPVEIVEEKTDSIVEEIVMEEPVEEIKPIVEEEPVVESIPEIIKTEVEEEQEPGMEIITEPIQFVAEEIKPITEEVTTSEIAAAPEKEQFLFEPLHTTDYFASVGIKLSEEEKSSDKLGKQLKSFTDWLKTMKKVHAEQLVKTTSPAEVVATNAESNIQKLAEKSNQDNEVITEAMAEVLLHQGKEDKAVEILEKLSLLNPSKNAYFASKINQIKVK